MVGITDLDKYWEMNPRVFQKYVNAKMKEIDLANFSLGRYVSIAFNNPKKYPKKPFLMEDKDFNNKKEMSDKEMEEVMKRNTIILGGTVNG